jgi:hypothetical protein
MRPEAGLTRCTLLNLANEADIVPLDRLSLVYMR